MQLFPGIATFITTVMSVAIPPNGDVRQREVPWAERTAGADLKSFSGRSYSFCIRKVTDISNNQINAQPCQSPLLLPCTSSEGKKQTFPPNSCEHAGGAMMMMT